MFNHLRPTWYAKKLIKINLDYLKTQGIKVLLFDLDNTIASYQETKPDYDILHFFSKIRKAGFNTYLISNNRYEKRVKGFAETLKMDAYLFNASKPKSKKLESFINKQKISIKSSVIIGDQLLTDVWLANSLKMKSLLVEPKSLKDLPITRINRIIDNKIRKYFRNKKFLIDVGQEIL